VCARTAELAATNEALCQQIAENQRTSDQLRQSQKMEAIGRLAGGIAHDFNNLLNVIIGYAAILQSRPDADAKLRDSTEQIVTAAEKAASLTRQLLAFSRKQVLQREVLMVDDILSTMGRMLPSLLGEDIALTLSLSAAAGYVRANRSQIEFFTTKDPGKGTGLGLATVYGIVKQSGGEIGVDSQVGRGTTLKVYLPRVTSAVPVTIIQQKLQAEERGSGTILLVEDQTDLRVLLSQVLEGSGYTVLEADSGSAAIDIADQHAGRIDLVITDVIMPGMRGWELVRRLSALRPGTKVLYISGHTDTDLNGDDGAMIRGAAFLGKPFGPDVLLHKVHEMFCAKKAAAAATAR
jgi:two-component system cell cycle sensor histidine kinase/response regulator CckA